MGIIGHDRVPVSLAAPHFINQFIKDTKKLSINMVGMVEKIKGKSTDILSIVQTEEEIRERVKDVFDNIIVERTQKLIIFIDELDRCKPTFAIEMLERIKHYFEDDRIIFVVSVNKEQLVHTISNYYGSGFDATRYLNKILYLIFDYPHKHYTFKYFEV
nr:P-loop NTPase fold protein [uncultured Blautia sp.]